jgi:hypothetical protein
MDTRTPGASIYYIIQQAVTGNITAANWTPNGGPTDTNTPAAPTQPADPRTTVGRVLYDAPITIGTVNTYTGIQWFVRAKAYTGATPIEQTESLWSTDSYEMAYRTVITYQLNNAGNAITAGAGEQTMGSGDQIWIRGGDAIGSSSVPGFPVTWEDNWDNLANRRAGIRLMRKTNTTSSLNNSEWKFVTWEINTTAYVDFILGRDTASSIQQAWQYGPTQWAYQRAGWTSFKDSYPIYPGKHRWCNAGINHEGKGAINFSGTWSHRSTGLMVNHTAPNVN